MEEEFNSIVEIINSKKGNQGITENFTSENKLDMYKYYKQATQGDCIIAEPWSINFEAHAKWKAWNSVKGMLKEEAMAAYVDLYKTFVS